MKTIKNLIMITFLSLILPATLSAFDFGFYLNNRTGLVYNQDSDNSAGTIKLKAEQRDMISLWLSTFIKEDFYIKVKAHFEFGTQLDTSVNEYKFLPIGDIDTFIFGGKINLNNSKANYLSFKLGRMFFKDFTSELAFTPIDGLNLGIGFDDLEINLTAGYTGMIYNWSNTQRMSYNDVVLNQDWRRTQVDIPFNTAKAVHLNLLVTLR